MSEWLDNLKAGDQVIVDRKTYYGPDLTLATVTRTTKTLIIVGNVKFSRSNAYRMGLKGLRSVLIREPTPQLLAQAESEQSLVTLNSQNWRNIDPAVRSKIVDLLKKAGG